MHYTNPNHAGIFRISDSDNGTSRPITIQIQNGDSWQDFTRVTRDEFQSQFTPLEPQRMRKKPTWALRREGGKVITYQTAFRIGFDRFPSNDLAKTNTPPVIPARATYGQL